MYVLMISPGYPAEMQYFTRGLARVGAKVLGVSDQAERRFAARRAREPERLLARAVAGGRGRGHRGGEALGVAGARGARRVSVGAGRAAGGAAARGAGGAGDDAGRGRAVPQQGRDEAGALGGGRPHAAPRVGARPPTRAATPRGASASPSSSSRLRARVPRTRTAWTTRPRSKTCSRAWATSKR